MLAATDYFETHSPSPNESKYHLKNGQLLINSSLAFLIKDHKVVQTWPLAGWSLLAFSRDERFAIFESDDDWLLGMLDVETGEWKADGDLMLPNFSIVEDEVGDCIYNQDSKERIYLRTENI